MSDHVARYSAAKFGSPTAHPLITAIYTVAAQWTPPPVTGMRLTPDTAETLRAEGCTMVRVRWRFRQSEISVRRYLGD